MRYPAALLLAAFSSLAHAQQAPNATSGITTVNNPGSVVSLLRGEVYLIGDHFPNLTFQKGVLALLRSGQIRVKVLTSPANVKNMLPLAQAGARVYTLPTRMTGALILVRGESAIFPVGDGWRVLKGQQNAGSVEAAMQPYWEKARPYNAVR